MTTKIDKIDKIRIILLGDSGVGKTCLMQKFVLDEFNTNHICTIGVDFKTKIMSFKNKPKKVYIWDTAGQERFRTITRTFYRGAMGIILVYDVTDRKSFKNITYWLKDIENNTNAPKIILVGNKCDLEKDRIVSYEEAERLAYNNNLNLYETSCKNGKNVETIFEEIFTNICEYYDSFPCEEDKCNNLKIENVKKKKNCEKCN